MWWIKARFPLVKRQLTCKLIWSTRACTAMHRRYLSECTCYCGFSCGRMGANVEEWGGWLLCSNRCNCQVSVQNVELNNVDQHKRGF